MQIPFSPPFVDQDVINEVLDSLNSGWITTGPKVRDLEIEVSKYAGIEKSLCVNSATSGMMLALKWFGIGKGDEVIIPAYTYAATGLVVNHIGATIKMVDIGDDFNITVENIRKAITPKTKAIVPVDIAGWPCDYDAIMALVQEPEIKAMFQPTHPNQHKLGRMLVMSDAAHSIGASYHGRMVGSLADITVLSLHAVKNVTTAEGGVICLNLPAPFDAEEEYKIMRLFTLNGQTKDAFTKSKAGGWRYDILFAGYKMNMPDLCAAVGLAQIRKYDNNLLVQRRRVFERYNEHFTKTGWAQIPPHHTDDRSSSCHLYALRINGITEEQRDAIIEHITAEQVAVNVHFMPMPLLTFFKSIGFKMEDYPVAFNNYSREISLPIYPQLTDEQVDKVVAAVINGYKAVIG